MYNKAGEVLRRISCPSTQKYLQTKDGKFVMEGTANDVTQKIEFDGFDEEGQPINPRVIDKSPEEIEADNPTPPEILFEKRVASITNEQWRGILKRLTVLER